MLTVSGGTAGTQVMVRMTLTFDDSLMSQKDGPGMAGGGAGGTLRASGLGGDGEGGVKWWYLDLGNTVNGNDTAGGLRTVQMEFLEEVGAQFQVDGYLQVYFNDTINTYNPGTFAKTEIDAAHTMHGYFDLVNPVAGMSLLADSGHDYSLLGTTPPPGGTVPEPSALGLAVLGMLALGRTRRARIQAPKLDAVDAKAN